MASAVRLEAVLDEFGVYQFAHERRSQGGRAGLVELLFDLEGNEIGRGLIEARLAYAAT